MRPNPFRGRTDIAFDVAQAGAVDLAILDVAGRRVRALATGSRLDAGPQNVMWDGRSDDGREAPAGVYWVQFRSAAGLERRRFVKLD